ncbi:MAG: alpha/beta hydrolase [Planctomycetes bacterium]|nr:alpha/beta hydrolase [Planctomycetota bacterium]
MPRTEHEIIYHESSVSDYCRLDVYATDNVKDAPVVVWFHGGGLECGDKFSGEALPIVMRLAKEGIVAVSVNYRMYPEVKYPVFIEDAAAAVGWAYRNIASRGGCPQKLFISGHSAGGYLAAMLAVVPSYLENAGVPYSDLKGAIPTSGQMVCHHSVRAERGITDKADFINDAAPISYASKDICPWFTLTGDNDMEDRTNENVRMLEALKKAGHQDCAFKEYAGRDHCSVVAYFCDPADPVARDVVDFIKARA